MPEFMDENLETKHVGGEIHPGETTEESRKASLVWALERGSRSGRVAWQFARDWAGRRRK